LEAWLKSGIDAHSEIIRGEDPAELEALTAAFLIEHHPTGANQVAHAAAIHFRIVYFSQNADAAFHPACKP
jgi:hypothetical protein